MGCADTVWDSFAHCGGLTVTVQVHQLVGFALLAEHLDSESTSTSQKLQNEFPLAALLLLG